MYTITLRTSAATMCLLLASTAAADPLLEVGGTTGIHFYSENSELGVPDSVMPPTQQNATPIGVRGGLFWRERYGVEAELAVLPTISRVQDFDVTTLTYRLQGVYEYPVPSMPKLVPFGLFGLGAMSVVQTQAQDSISRDTDFIFYFGAGAKYRLREDWGVRGDARLLLPPSSVGDSVTDDYELLISVYKEWGRKTEHVNRDRDGDGILDDIDACDGESEDTDGFEDENGCPDLDNDKDGIADASDKCINDPEDKDTFEDEDGCPELDNDKDTIADATDKCPNEAEDKDKFQDDDGCPDPDNDQDGILDLADKCRLEPETENGYQDTDGCPDEVPVVVQRFTGVIQGINFTLGKADILSSSFKTLDAAVEVLKQFPDLNLEIAGHTDDRAMIPGSPYKDNVELSKARAESVKAYMVKKGIAEGRLLAQGYGETQPVEPPAGLKGGALDAARAKNRRVEFKPISLPAAPAAAPAPTTTAPTTTAPTPTTDAPAPVPAPTPKPE
jgi:outer membrane protein OmpA-like peptidoglycan-associated protein